MVRFMESKYLGDIYFIKDGKVLKNIATINNENMSKQSFPGFGKALKLYSDKELDNGNEEILDIYKQSLDNNITIVRAFHKAIGNMGEVTLLDDYDVDIYIPLNFISILVVGFLGISGLVLLIVFYIFIF